MHLWNNSILNKLCRWLSRTNHAERKIDSCVTPSHQKNITHRRKMRPHVFDWSNNSPIPDPGVPESLLSPRTIIALPQSPSPYPPLEPWGRPEVSIRLKPACIQRYKNTLLLFSTSKSKTLTTPPTTHQKAFLRNCLNSHLVVRYE